MSCDHIIGPARLLLEASSDPIVLFEHPVWTAPRELKNNIRGPMLLAHSPSTCCLGYWRGNLASPFWHDHTIWRQVAWRRDSSGGLWFSGTMSTTASLLSSYPWKDKINPKDVHTRLTAGWGMANLDIYPLCVGPRQPFQCAHALQATLSQKQTASSFACLNESQLVGEGSS